jgi:mRNA interferase RelE/StbE
VSYQVNWEVQALDRTAGFLSDDLAGVRGLWESVSWLAEEPRPPESFPYGSPDLRRLRAGRYRIFYTIDEDRKLVQTGSLAAMEPRVRSEKSKIFIPKRP